MRFCGLTDDDLLALRDRWAYHSDERGHMGTKIIDELMHLRLLVRENVEGAFFEEDILEDEELDLEE